MSEPNNNKNVIVEKPIQLGVPAVDQTVTPAPPFNPNASSLPPNAEAGMESAGQEAPAEAAPSTAEILGGGEEAASPSETAEAPAAEAPAAEPAPEPAPAAEQPAPDPAEDTLDGTPQETHEGEDQVLEDFRKKGTTKKDARKAAGVPEGDEAYDLDINQVIICDPEQLVKILDKKYPTKESVQAARNDPNSMLNKIRTALERGWGSTAGKDYTDVLLRDETYKHLKAQHEDDQFKDGRPRKIAQSSVSLTGEEAMLAMKARLGGLVRLNLLNSGFWIVLRAPTLAELQQIFASIDLENRQIGRMIGGHFALIVDVYLKRKVIELLVQNKLIMKSNFAGFKNVRAFVQNLAYHDYETIIHGLVTLMSRNGFRCKLVCPHCDTESIEQNLDISATKYYNMDLMSEPVRQYWATTRDEKGQPIVHSAKDLANYRKNILGFKHTIVQKVPAMGENIQIEMVLSEPTMDKFFAVGDMLVNKLNATIDGIANGDESKEQLVKNSLQIHGFQLIAPWVETLDIRNADTNEVEVSTPDSAVIIDHLDTILQDDNVSIFNELHEFVKKSRFNYFGTFSLECPNCHHKPETKLDNFYPLEIQTIFFGLFFRHLLVAR